MAENNKHKKIVKVVDIIRVPISKKEKKIRDEAEDTASDRSSKAMEDLEELVSYRDTAKQKQEVSPKPKKIRKGHKLLWSVIIVAVLIVTGYVVFWMLPKVSVDIVTKKVEWQTQQSIIVKVNGQIDPSTSQIGGEIFKQQKNIVVSYLASGKKNLSNKAAGTFTIYNVYSSAPQTLVATTRLQAPNGKIYRLVSQVVVPGAKVLAGKITPSSIDVDVTADQAGPDYNSGAITKLTIPGLKRTPKYDGFYASAPNGISGGFIGQGAYPTADDISKAKQQAQTTLAAALDPKLIVSMSDGLTYAQNSVYATTTKLTVNTNTDSSGQFTVVADGVVQVMAYKETDVLELLRQKAQKDTSMPDDYTIKDKTLSYGQPTNDWKLRKMTLPVNFTATYWKVIDTAQLASSIAGKSDIAIKSLILSMEGVDKLTVDFWPLWVNSAPSKLSKISITVE